LLLVSFNACAAGKKNTTHNKSFCCVVHVKLFFHPRHCFRTCVFVVLFVVVISGGDGDVGDFSVVLVLSVQGLFVMITFSCAHVHFHFFFHYSFSTSQLEAAADAGRATVQNAAHARAQGHERPRQSIRSDCSGVSRTELSTRIRTGTLIY